jgi:hypothetical protein
MESVAVYAVTKGRVYPVFADEVIGIAEVEVIVEGIVLFA